jgi:tricorn protease
MTTWGGLVKSSTHYSFVDGGRMTAPDNAVFDPINNKWIAENIGVAPDIEVRQDAKALSNGNDPQLEKGVAELMKQLGVKKEIKAPKFQQPAKGN